jgi:hypothetical protein
LFLCGEIPWPLKTCNSSRYEMGSQIEARIRCSRIPKFLTADIRVRRKRGETHLCPANGPFEKLLDSE